MHEKILILDFGAQYTQLIARRVREAKVYCEIHPHDVPDDFVRGFGARGIILSGSHMSAYEESTGKAPPAVFDLGVPVLGICYGMQTMAQQLGGRVAAGSVREFGYAEVRAHGHTRLLEGIEDFRTAEGHGAGLVSLAVRSSGRWYEGLVAGPTAWAWTRDNGTYLAGLLVLLVALGVIHAALTLMLHAAAAAAALDASYRLRRSVYLHTLRLGRLSIRGIGGGEAVATFTRDLEAVQEGDWMRITGKRKH